MTKKGNGEKVGRDARFPFSSAATDFFTSPQAGVDTEIIGDDACCMQHMHSVCSSASDSDRPTRSVISVHSCTRKSTPNAYAYRSMRIPYKRVEQVVPLLHAVLEVRSASRDTACVALQACRYTPGHRLAAAALSQARCRHDGQDACRLISEGDALRSGLDWAQALLFCLMTDCASRLGSLIFTEL